MRRLRGVAGLLACLCVPACGPPEPPNMRGEFEKGLKNFGVMAFYPLRELVRLGQLSGGQHCPPRGRRRPLPRPDERRPHERCRALHGGIPRGSHGRAKQVSLFVRQALPAQILSGQTASDAISSRTAPPRAAAPIRAPADSSATTITNEFILNVQTGAVTPKPASPAAPGKPPPPKPPELLTPLELAGFPNYSLASMDSFTGAGAVPTAFASFLVAVGFSHSTSSWSRAKCS